jgi:hypothetical protein
MHPGSISTVEYMRPSADNVFCCCKLDSVIVRFALSWETVKSALDARGMTFDHCCNLLNCVDGWDELDSVLVDINYCVMVWYWTDTSWMWRNVLLQEFDYIFWNVQILTSVMLLATAAVVNILKYVFRQFKYWNVALFIPGWFVQAGPYQ